MGAMFESLLNMFAGMVEATSYLWIYLDVPINRLIEDFVESIPVIGFLYENVHGFLTDIFGLNITTFLDDVSLLSLITTFLPAIVLYMVLKNFVYR